MGWPGTLWWINAFGRRSARSEGRSIANGSQASVRLSGPSASSRSQQHRRPSSSQVPSRISPPGANRAVISDHASGTDSTSYWRRTLNARTNVGRRLANSKPPRANSTGAPPAVARAPRTRSGIDLQSHHPDVVAHAPQPSGQLQGRHGKSAVPEVDDQWLGRREQCGSDPWIVHQPAVAAAQPVVARGAPRQLTDGPFLLQAFSLIHAVVKRCSAIRSSES